MDRRHALKAMGVAALAELTGRDLLALGARAQAQTGASEGRRHSFKALDPSENETVIAVAELIIPETDTPGAKAARVNEFVDVMLAEWFTDEERDRFRRGLAGLNEDGAFVSRPVDEQVAILERAEEEALTIQRERESGGGPVAESDSPADAPFFSVMKWLTLFGYYTSRVGMEQELHYEVFPGSYDGCAPIRPFNP